MIAGILKEIKIEENPEIKKGANVIKGQVIFQGVADAFGLKRTDIEKLLQFNPFEFNIA